MLAKEDLAFAQMYCASTAVPAMGTTACTTQDKGAILIKHYKDKLEVRDAEGNPVALSVAYIKVSACGPKVKLKPNQVIQDCKCQKVLYSCKKGAVPCSESEDSAAAMNV